MKKTLSFLLYCCFIGNSILANSCPYTNGPTVYQARVLLNVLYDRYMRYPDNCPQASNARLGNKEQDKTKTGEDTQFDAVLFPNPGANTFNIATFGLTEGEIEINICDVTGKLVYQNKLDITNALTQFELDVKNGIYFVKINIPILNNTIIKKLVVQK